MAVDWSEVQKVAQVWQVVQLGNFTLQLQAFVDHI